MKVITVSAPMAWAIFNAKCATGDTSRGHFCANFTIIRRYESIACPSKIAIHARKHCYPADCEHFFKTTGIKVPDYARLPRGQVLMLVDVLDCQPVDDRWNWKIANPESIRHFHWKGQPSIYEVPDSQIDFDISKNPILEESGYKLKGNPKGEWRVTVWAHPTQENHYSFAVGIGGGIMGSGIPGYSTLHGCYLEPEEALQAGIKELYS